jgi:hypothetical protein
MKLCRLVLLAGMMAAADRSMAGMADANLSPQARIFDGNYDFEFLDQSDFSETLFYDVRFDLPEDIIRNRRDSSFFPGNKPAGVKGITKELLDFIKHKVNPLGFEVSDEGRTEEREKFEEGYENAMGNYIHIEEDHFF